MVLLPIMHCVLYFNCSKIIIFSKMAYHNLFDNYLIHTQIVYNFNEIHMTQCVQFLCEFSMFITTIYS